MEFVVNSNTIIGIAGLISAIGVIIGVIKSMQKTVNKYEGYEAEIVKINKEIKGLKDEQCMQTYVLEAVLDGLHQLGCNGKTTEASEKLSKFINQKAHGQE